MAKKARPGKGSRTPSKPVSPKETDKAMEEIRTLLKSKTARGVEKSMALLGRLDRPEEVWIEACDERVVGDLIETWDEGVWKALVDGARPSPSLLALVCEIAIKKVSQLSAEDWQQRLESLLNILPEAFAESLAKYKGYCLDLNLDDLSEAAAQALARCKGTKIILSSGTTFTDGAIESLLKHKADVSIDGEAKLSTDAGLSLIVRRMTSLSPAVADTLAKRWKGQLNLDLDELTSLSDAAAESLAKVKGRLRLAGLTTISETTAESLAKHEGALSLRGLTKISDAVAERLAKCKGHLDLDGLKELSVAAAKSLAKHRGENLQLGGIKTISAEIAAVLAKYEGTLDLCGLGSLSDEAAEGLRKHKGLLKLNDKMKLSEKAAKCLEKHEGQVYFSSSWEL